MTRYGKGNGVKLSDNMKKVKWDKKKEEKKRKRETGEKFGWAQAMLCGYVTG